MLVDAIEIMKYPIREVGNEAEHLNHAEKIIRRVVEALIRHDGIMKGNINVTHLLYGPIRLHGINLYLMNKFCLIQE